MNLNQLHYFVTLAYMEHYTKAAKQLSITQPSPVSYTHLKKQIFPGTEKMEMHSFITQENWKMQSTQL